MSHDNSPFLAKSLVPGKGYVKATEMTSGMKNVVRTRLKLKGKSHFPVPGKKVEGQSAKGRQVYPEHETRSMGRRVSTDVIDDKQIRRGTLKGQGWQELGHSKPNGRGGGIIRMNTKASKEEQAATYKHEIAHINPKRNPVRFFERTASDSKRLGREEGRADYTANGKKTPGAYPGDRRFQRGYKEVQDKMHDARKPRKFAVDAKGQAELKKCAFGVIW